MFKKFINWVKEGDSKVLISFIGVFTLSGMAYLAYKNIFKRTDKSNIQIPSEINVQGGIEHQAQGLKFPLMLQKVIANIKMNAKDEKSSIRAIYQGYHELAIPQFIKITRIYRKERREVMDNLTKYQQILRQYQKQIQTARMRCLITILTYFKFELTEWFRLISRYSSQNKQEWYQLTVLTDIMQLNALQDPPQKPIQSQLLIQVFQYKYQIFQQVLQQTTSLIKPQDNDVYIFIDRRLMDLIHSKFGFEDQDIFLSMIAMGSVAKERIQNIEEQIRTRISVFTINRK